MNTVHKFEVHRPGAEPSGRRTVPLPQGATLLTAGAQDGAVYVWALVDTSRALAARAFTVVETGADVGDTLFASTYVGIARLRYPGGEYVLHVFDGGY